ncbi:MAG: hypothetical protein ACKOW9_02690, partial [Candidatus Paceibacterota bacterium]
MDFEATKKLKLFNPNSIKKLQIPKEIISTLVKVDNSLSTGKARNRQFYHVAYTELSKLDLCSPEFLALIFLIHIIKYTVKNQKQEARELLQTINPNRAKVLHNAFMKGEFFDTTKVRQRGAAAALPRVPPAGGIETYIETRRHQEMMDQANLAGIGFTRPPDYQRPAQIGPRGARVGQVPVPPVPNRGPAPTGAARATGPPSGDSELDYIAGAAKQARRLEMSQILRELDALDNLDISRISSNNLSIEVGRSIHTEQSTQPKIRPPRVFNSGGSKQYNFRGRYNELAELRYNTLVAGKFFDDSMLVDFKAFTEGHPYYERYTRIHKHIFDGVRRVLQRQSEDPEESLNARAVFIGLIPEVIHHIVRSGLNTNYFEKPLNIPMADWLQMPTMQRIYLAFLYPNHFKGRRYVKALWEKIVEDFDNIRNYGTITFYLVAYGRMFAKNILNNPEQKEFIDKFITGLTDSELGRQYRANTEPQVRNYVKFDTADYFFTKLVLDYIKNSPEQWEAKEDDIGMLSELLNFWGQPNDKDLFQIYGHLPDDDIEMAVEEEIDPEVIDPDEIATRNAKREIRKQEAQDRRIAAYERAVIDAKARKKARKLNEIRERQLRQAVDMQDTRGQNVRKGRYEPIITESFIYNPEEFEFDLDIDPQVYPTAPAAPAAPRDAPRGAYIGNDRRRDINIGEERGINIGEDRPIDFEQYVKPSRQPRVLEDQLRPVLPTARGNLPAARENLPAAIPGQGRAFEQNYPIGEPFLGDYDDAKTRRLFDQWILKYLNLGTGIFINETHRNLASLAEFIWWQIHTGTALHPEVNQHVINIALNFLLHEANERFFFHIRDYFSAFILSAKIKPTKDNYVTLEKLQGLFPDSVFELSYIVEEEKQINTDTSFFELIETKMYRWMQGLSPNLDAWFSRFPEYNRSRISILKKADFTWIDTNNYTGALDGPSSIISGRFREGDHVIQMSSIADRANPSIQIPPNTVPAHITQLEQDTMSLIRELQEEMKRERGSYREGVLDALNGARNEIEGALRAAMNSRDRQARDFEDDAVNQGSPEKRREPQIRASNMDISSRWLENSDEARREFRTDIELPRGEYFYDQKIFNAGMIDQIGILTGQVDVDIPRRGEYPVTAQRVDLNYFRDCTDYLNNKLEIIERNFTKIPEGYDVLERILGIPTLSALHALTILNPEEFKDLDYWMKVATEGNEIVLREFLNRAIGVAYNSKNPRDLLDTIDKERTVYITGSFLHYEEGLLVLPFSGTFDINCIFDPFVNRWKTVDVDLTTFYMNPRFAPQILSEEHRKAYLEALYITGNHFRSITRSPREVFESLNQEELTRYIDSLDIPIGLDLRDASDLDTANNLWLRNLIIRSGENQNMLVFRDRIFVSMNGIIYGFSPNADPNTLQAELKQITDILEGHPIENNIRPERNAQNLRRLNINRWTFYDLVTSSYQDII